jgi:predicted Zn-dependent peptidase
MEEIRVKRGLAYSAYASLSQNLSHSDIKGHLQTKIDSQDEAIELVKEVIKKFVRDGVTSNELDQAKKFLLGSEPLRRESLHQRLNRAFMIYYKGFDSNYYQDELKKIESLKIEELNSFIKSHKEIENISLSIVTKGD